MEDLNVVVVGDRGVGKTSLLWALSNEKFIPEDQAPPHLPVIVIPSEAMAGGERTTYIVDTSLRSQEEAEIMSEMAKANVICMVYSVVDSESFERLESYWMPLARKALLSDGDKNSIPVVLVGNKTDLREGKDKNLERKLLPLMEKFNEISVCLESSAKALENVSKIFVYAKMCVLHPIAPLYDKSEHKLTPAFVNACKRIFFISDTNADGLLSDGELRAFQVKCFDSPVSDSELEHLKEIIRMDCADGMQDSKINFEGFVCMMKVFLEKNQFESIWIILRRFCYNDDLTISNALLHPTFDFPAHAPITLSNVGIHFLEALFVNHSDKYTGVLSRDNLERILEVLPKSLGVMFGSMIKSDDISLEQFINTWNLLALEKPQTTIELCAILGFVDHLESKGTMNASASSALQVQQRRVVEKVAGKTTRNIFSVLLLGDAAKRRVSDKLLQCDGARMKDDLSTKTIGKLPSSEEDGRSSCRLVLHEVPSAFEVTETLSDSVTEEYDLVCLVYERGNQDSFQYIAELHNNLGVPGPKLLMFAFDNGEQSQGGDKSEEYCQKHELPSPLQVDDDVNLEILGTIAAEAQKFSSAPGSGTSSNAGMLLLAGVLVVVGIFAYRQLRKQ